MLLFLVLGVSGLFTLATLNINYSSVRLTNTSLEKFERTQAANLASSGINLAISKLNLDTTWAGINGQQFGPGSLTLTVATTTSQYPGGPNMGLTSMRLISSTGTVNNQSVTISSVFRLTTNPTAPPFLQYAMASGNDLQLQGSIDVRDDNNTNWNANIHSNNNLQTTGNAYSVRGFGTYSDQLESSKNNFSPNQNPNSLPVNYKIPPITIPVFNPTDYLSIATNISNGDLTVTGPMVLGSKSNPVIYYVNGNLNFRGSTTGYGIFIVTGNINFNGNVTVNSQDPTASNIGFYAGGNIQASGNINLAGQMYASQNIQASGNFTLIGSMTARNNIQLSGNPTIRYRPANSSLTKQFWPTATNLRPAVISYYE